VLIESKFFGSENPLLPAALPSNIDTSRSVRNLTMAALKLFPIIMLRNTYCY